MYLGGVPLRVAVAGGSIGGLCAGVALRGIGCEVELYERTPGAMASRGAGIVVQDDLRRLLQRHGAPELPTTSCLQRQCEGWRIRSALGVEAEPFTRVAGPASLWLARPLGFDLPLSPLKGYSFIVPVTGGAASCLSVTDSKRMIVYAPPVREPASGRHSAKSGRCRAIAEGRPIPGEPLLESVARCVRSCLQHGPGVPRSGPAASSRAQRASRSGWSRCGDGTRNGAK